MCAFPRLLTAAALVPLFACALLLLRDWPPGFDLGTISGSMQRLHAATQRGRDLDERMARALARLESQMHVARELAAGRLTLFEAAARLRDLPSPPAAFWEELSRVVPGRNDEERLCRQVIGWLPVAFGEQSIKARAVAARLEAELERCLEKEATIRLPRTLEPRPRSE